MNYIDFIIGLTMVNSIPHFVLGIWKGRILSGLGISNRGNIAYGILNFLVSISLYTYHYGIESILKNGIYAGGMVVVVLYFILGKFLYNVYHKRYYERKKISD